MGIDGVILDVAVPTEGGEAFLGEVRAQGIPLRRAHGADEYAAALAHLGTPPGTTWVLARSLASLRQARRLGLRCVCVLDERDAASMAELEGACDILVHGLRELTLALIQDYVPPVSTDELTGEVRVLIVNGSPQLSSPALVGSLARSADYVIAADRGAEALRAAGVVPDVFCGDADSVSPETATWACQRASADILYPKDKYESDLGLAVACARHEADRRRANLALTLTCTSGGRPDHALTVMGSLVKAIDTRPRVIEDGYECRLLAPTARSEWRMDDAVGQTFSVVALREGTIVSECGFKWDLDHREVDFLGGWGLTLSNVVTADPCLVTCHAGMAAAFLIASA